MTQKSKCCLGCGEKTADLMDFFALICPPQHKALWLWRKLMNLGMINLSCAGRSGQTCSLMSPTFESDLGLPLDPRSVCPRCYPTAANRPP